MRWTIMIVSALLLGGCHAEPPPAHIQYYIRSPEALLALDRVAVLDLPELEEYPDVPADMTQALVESLQAKQLFQFQRVSRAAPALRDLRIDGGSALSVREMAALREAAGCDAVLMGRIRQFRPHPRMAMGLSLRLVDLRRGRLIFGIDHTWDTTQRPTEHRVQEYFERQARSGYDPANWRLALMSPRAFERFVAHEVASCFPTREQAMEDVAASRRAREAARAATQPAGPTLEKR